MKKISFFALSALVLMASCKKSGSSSGSCPVTVAALVGTYKISKIEAITAGISSDITTKYLLSCELDDTYQFNADKTLVHKDAGSVCSSNGSDNGTWDIVNGKITASSLSVVDFSNNTITNTCNGMVIEESASSNASIKYTFSKQ